MIKVFAVSNTPQKKKSILAIMTTESSYPEALGFLHLEELIIEFETKFKQLLPKILLATKDFKKNPFPKINLLLKKWEQIEVEARKQNIK